MSAITIVPVVLSGGAGTRLWPLSRPGRAKQLIEMLGGASPFARTLARLAEPATFAAPIVVAGAEQRFLVAEEAGRAGGPAPTLLLEPEGRDTCAAILAGAAWAARRHGPEAIVLVTPSDHLVPDVAAFRAAAATAARVAAEGVIVTLGIAPSGPATGYGYIRPGAALGEGARRIEAFVEKPDAGRAAELIAEGCLWNAGLFCFRAETALAEARAFAPDVLASVTAALDAGADDLGALRLGPDYATTRKASFDVAIMERTRRAAVLPVGFAWSDIGDWRELWAVSAKDAAGVAVDGARAADVRAVDCHDVYVRADSRLVATLGLSDVVIVDTPDALLVADKGRAQEVKALAQALAAEGRPEAREPARVLRPWGWYQTVDRGERFRVKRISVTPGKKLSLQRHHHRAEHWVVVRGTAEVTVDARVSLLRENESIFIPMGATHRLANPGRIPVEIIEVQTGAYLEEDDIVRIEDDFGRG